MKKMISCLTLLFLSLCIMLSLCACNDDSQESSDAEISEGAGNSENSVVYSVGVMSDMQIQPEASIDDTENGEYHELMEYYGYHSINAYSEAIFKNSVDEYIASGVKNIFMVGDLSNDGDTRSFATIKDACEKFKNAGINVFLTFGICDLYGEPKNHVGKGTTDAELWDSACFKSDFYGYMGAEPYSEDTDSLSYAVDVPNSNMTLISLDTASSFKIINFPNAGTHYFRHSAEACDATQTTSDSLINWFNEALSSANMRNRDIYVTTYFPLDENMTSFYNDSTNDGYIYCDRNAEVKALCTFYKVSAVFSGHLHTQAQKTYSDENGSTELFVLGSLSTYPLPIQIYKSYKNGNSELVTKQINAINASYLPSYTTEEARQALTQNALEYAKSVIKKGFYNKWKTSVYGNPRDTKKPYMSSFLKKLSLYTYGSQACERFISLANKWLESDVNDLPLYGAGESVESICASHGITLPQSSYTTVFDFMGEMVCTMYDGTFDLSAGSLNSQILRYSMYSGIEKLAQIDPLRLLNDINSNVLVCEYSAMIDRLFKEDIIDLKSDDLIRCIMSIIAVAVNTRLGREVITINSSEEILAGLNMLLSAVILPVLNLVEPNAYDPANETVWLIEYKKVLIMPEGLLDCGYFIDVMGAELISSNAVFKF